MKQEEFDALCSALAQGVINIDTGHCTIEKGSLVYRGMLGIVKLLNSGELMRNPNVPDEDSTADRKLFMSAAIELLGATRDNETEGRWKYYAEETGSYWSVTGDALAALGKKLDGKKPAQTVYEKWAEEDTTAIEMKGRKSYSRPKR